MRYSRRGMWVKLAIFGVKGRARDRVVHGSGKTPSVGGGFPTAKGKAAESPVMGLFYRQKAATEMRPTSSHPVQYLIIE